jgi:hypothetical protein
MILDRVEHSGTISTSIGFGSAGGYCLIAYICSPVDREWACRIKCWQRFIFNPKRQGFVEGYKGFSVESIPLW